MKEAEKILRQKARELLEEGEFATLIGYGRSWDAFHVSPIFVRDEDAVKELILNPFCVNNLAKYVLRVEGKVAIVAKGCDARSLIALVQENQVKREDVFILGLPCKGMADPLKVQTEIDPQTVKEVTMSGEDLIIKTGMGETSIPLAEVIFDKCSNCEHPNPPLYDHLLNEKVEVTRVPNFQAVEKLEVLSISERYKYWIGEFRRCIRCFACRNVCPLCYCEDDCILQQRSPHWISLRVNEEENWMFQIIRAFHVAGRCTGCGECDRVCPMNIPLSTLNQKIARDVKELFDYTAGIDIEAIPPLLVFKEDDSEVGSLGR